MIDQLDNLMMQQGVKFDSSIVVSQGVIFYFNDGLLVAEVEVKPGPFGQPYVTIFETKNKLWK